ncbi:hypothetical protein COCMIDRAFT_35275 [Bipolaris oryzae ATCC 44560]|uniref:Uncharacterized protein n=1 Tax=Bipolaris oryzae ATCC 44560 TaxID=930090 RepID=W6ZI68_COCMI|nr:uncharacterized protein COCMIDRAFT_35275 [Bipolaris oryzae ATCC 44560]EUC47124.1 hypothetical protein COCMIDRAFT_35275 [Bipolaris oryzae ATCC 44560]
MSCLSTIRSIFQSKKKKINPPFLTEKPVNPPSTSPRPSVSTSTQTSTLLPKPPLHTVPSAIVSATEKGMISASLCSVSQSPSAPTSSSTTTQTTSAPVSSPFSGFPLASPSPLSLSSSELSPFVPSSPVSPVSKFEGGNGEKRESESVNSTTTLTRGEEACVSGQSSRRTSVRFKGLDV